MKKMTRAGAAALRAAEQLNTLALLNGQPHAQTANNSVKIGVLRRASAEAQHHDAVDGTSPARVTRMWEDHLQQGSKTAAPAIASASTILLTAAHANQRYEEDDSRRSSRSSRSTPISSSSPQWSVDVGEAVELLAQGKPIKIAVHNPLPRVSTTLVSIQVPSRAVNNKTLTVHASDGGEVAADLLPDTWPVDRGQCRLPPTTLVFVNPRKLMGCSNPLRRGVGAPHQCPLGSLASYLIYADLRTFR